MTDHPGGTTCEQFNHDVRATMDSHRHQVERLERERDAILVEQNVIVEQVHQLATERDRLREWVAELEKGAANEPPLTSTEAREEENA